MVRAGGGESQAHRSGGRTAGPDDKEVTICFTRSPPQAGCVDAVAQAFASQTARRTAAAPSRDECDQSHFSEFFEKPLSARFTESYQLNVYILPYRALVPLMTVEGFSR
jgi:hypothetical protein